MESESESERETYNNSCNSCFNFSLMSHSQLQKSLCYAIYISQPPILSQHNYNK